MARTSIELMVDSVEWWVVLSADGSIKAKACFPGDSHFPAYRTEADATSACNISERPVKVKIVKVEG